MAIYVRFLQRHFWIIPLMAMYATSPAHALIDRWTVIGSGEVISAADCGDCDEDTGMMLSCQGPGKKLLLEIPGAADELGIENREVPVVISSAGETHELSARSKEWGLIGFVPTLEISMYHPLMEALQAGRAAQVRFGEVETDISLTGSREAIGALLQQCPGE